MNAAVVRADALSLPLPDESVDLIVTSPPYFALRSYQDDDGHYDGQIGSEATPADFLVALWRVLDECWRVLKPSGSCWVNLGDKYAGSGGHNNSNLSRREHAPLQGGKRTLEANSALVNAERAKRVGGGGADRRAAAREASRRQAPDRYNQSADVLPKSVMGLPWRFALGASCPDPYRTVYDEGDHPQWVNRRPLIWFKPNGLPESVTDRTRANFEDWFMLTKQGRYFSAVDEIREPQTAPERQGSFNGAARTGRTDGVARDRGWQAGELDYNPLGKLPGSVWTIPSEPLIVPEAIQKHYGLPDHFAAFPQEWPRRIILGFSPSGICTACGEGRRPVVEKQLEHVNNSQMSRSKDLGGQARAMTYVQSVARETASITGHACACPAPDAPTRPPLVIDPFGGTGTVAGVANALGRHGISFDLSGAYCRLARWRIRESGHFAKAASRTDRDRQGVMFDGAA